MRTIVLKSMQIKNFKGIEYLGVEFTNRTEICGRNGLGKTSIQDAFLWCLFGKDSTGASSFSVKPLDENGKMIEYADVDVFCHLIIDGVDVTLRRRWEEKRTKTGEYKGNEGKYFINEAPVKESEFATYINGICDESLFKLITSTGAFNRMKDADRRKVLAAMSDAIKDDDIAQEFPNVLKALQQGKSVEQFKEEIKNQRSRAKVELEQYPHRLRENADMRPVVSEDVTAYPILIEQKKAEIETIKSKIASQDAEAGISHIKSQIEEKNQDIRDIISSIEKEREVKLNALKTAQNNLEERKKQIVSLIETEKKMLNSLSLQESEQKSYLESIKAEWIKVNSSTISAEVDSVCPTCGKPFSQDDIETKKNEIVQSFNEDKLQRLKEIDSSGKSTIERIKSIKDEYESHCMSLTSYEIQHKEIENNLKSVTQSIVELVPVGLVLEASLEYKKLKTQVYELEVKLNTYSCSEVKSELRDKVISLENEVLVMQAEISKVDEIKRLDARKAELEKKQKEMAQLVANYEQIEAEILAFSMKKTNLIEQSISSKFRLVKFKMFEYNLTNDGVREVCICTVNGVPYKDLNTAMQYNADIDIINALSNHYKIVAPVFIDRAESINNIEDTKSQRIDLYATKEDTSLRINHIC